MKNQITICLAIFFTSTVVSANAGAATIKGDVGCITCTIDFKVKGEYANCHAFIRTDKNRYYDIKNTYDFPGKLFDFAHDDKERSQAIITIKSTGATKTSAGYKITEIEAASVEIAGKTYKPKSR